MNKYVKGAIIFVGGTVVGTMAGSAMTIYAETKNKVFRNAIAISLSERFFGDVIVRNRPQYVYYNTMTNKRMKLTEPLIFDTEENAEDVLASMKQIAKDYGQVTVADSFDLSGVSTCYTDNKKGWTLDLLNKALIVRERDGYELKLPNPIEMN